MRNGLRRLRGALLMGLAWAVVWAPVGILIGMIVDPDGAMDEPWIAVGAYPGFIGGVLFSVVLAIAASRRRFDELSIPKFAAWGALAGVVLGVIPFLIGESTFRTPPWLLGAVFISSTTLLCALSAAGSLALARRGERRALRDAGAEAAEVGLTRDEVKELLGGK